MIKYTRIHRLTTEELFQRMQRAYTDFLAKAETFRAQLEKEAATAGTAPARIAIIQKTVAEAYEIPLIAMTSSSRVVRYSHPRQIAMMFCRQLTKHTLEEIGGNFGGKDHGTVSHAVTVVAERVATEPLVAGKVSEIREMLTDRIRMMDEPLLARVKR